MSKIPEKHQIKVYGDYLRKAAELDPAYRPFLKTYRIHSDICEPPKIAGKEEDN